jgi:hypothetical protein
MKNRGRQLAEKKKRHLTAAFFDRKRTDSANSPSPPACY